MKLLGIFAILLAANIIPNASSKGVPCESIKNGQWELSDKVGKKTCVLYDTTAIDSIGYQITSPRDEEVVATDYDSNDKIEYLAENVDEKFPNLKIIFASSCSIKSISKKSFRNLNKLDRLVLYGNQITRIDDETFNDLTSLQFLDLADNKIKQLNGNAFDGLTKLEQIFLNKNECINEDFEYSSQISRMSQAVSQKCGY